jgi:CHAT domain-containing protein
VKEASSASEKASANSLIQQSETQISGVLEWLWDSIAEPVLVKLGYTSTCPLNEECPRIWWCPSGRVSSLPVHAAGYHNDPSSGRTVLDRVVSTYTSAVRMLEYSRAKEIRLSTQNVVIAAMPETPRQGNLRIRKLPTARDEAWKVKSISKKFGNTVVSEEKVTVGKLQKIISNASIAHFACHAIYEPQDPSSSRLLLQDGGLSVSQIAQWNLRKGALAYLSACSTAFTGASLWEDEAITLASAFQIAGFSRVVGTLWVAEDVTSFEVAQSFYEFLQNDTSRSAFALHAAVVQQRTRALSEPSRWAAFIYNGA